MTHARLLIATPVDGLATTARVTWGYHQAVRQFERAGAVIIGAESSFADDISRARSRIACSAVERPGWDWLLWWDDDVVPQDTTIVQRMLECGHDWVGAPYPRKRIPAAFPYRPLRADRTSGRLPVVNGCIEVQDLSIGFTLQSRKCLEDMIKHYDATEWWIEGDGVGGWRREVGIFRQVRTAPEMVPDGKGGTMEFCELMSEDYSACWRWRQMGGKIQMYVGPGAPVNHVGMHSFKGEIREIGNAV